QAVPVGGSGSRGRDDRPGRLPGRLGRGDRPAGIPLLWRSAATREGDRRPRSGGVEPRRQDGSLFRDPGRRRAVTRSSEVPGFYRRTVEERREFVRAWADLSEGEVHAFDFPPGIDPATLDHMIENVIGVMPLPLGIATNFRINGRDYLIPMAIEEPSVVAAASNSAKVVRAAGGFSTQSSAPVMIGQVQILDVPDPAAARLRILDRKSDLLAAANAKDPVLVKFGGGAKDIEVRLIRSTRGPMLIVHLLVDARDAGGMNAVNTMCEALAPDLAKLAGGRVVLRIISN